MIKTHGSWNSPFVNYVVSKEEYNSRVSWGHLTDEEKKLVCDGGCGLNIFGYKIIPDFIFKDCCCHHDFLYLRGGDERVRLLGEKAFHQEMLYLAKKSSRPRYYTSVANIYYHTVSSYGWMFWDYGYMRTKEEILREARRSHA